MWGIGFLILFIRRRATTIIDPPKRKVVGEGIVWLAVKLECEYRSLSSHFSSGKNLIEWSFRNSKRAIEYVNTREVERLYNMADFIKNVINNENKQMAEILCKDFNLEII